MAEEELEIVNCKNYLTDLNCCIQWLSAKHCGGCYCTGSLGAAHVMFHLYLCCTITSSVCYLELAVCMMSSA